MSETTLRTTCAVAGGGPAGMMLGYLLARAGIDVIVIEKHADFLRDFRGDTIHPSTLEIMYQLGLDEALLQRPHQKIPQLSAGFGDRNLPLADFRPLPVHHPFIALMPQWDFLDFLAEEGRKLPCFKLLMRHEATGTVEEDGKVVGLRVATPEGEIAIGCDLVVAADGRRSTLRGCTDLNVEDIGAPMDVLWFSLPRLADDPAQAIGRVARGGLFVMIDRGDYWQCGMVIPKGGFDAVRAHGIAAFRGDVQRFAPFLGERTRQIENFDAVKLLTVGVDRMPRWHRPGLLFIGDAAHTMSPIGGIGINLAIQDAVAAANLLAKPLRRHRVTETELAKVQKRREFAVKTTQAGQVFIQKTLIAPLLDARNEPSPPLIMRLLAVWPWLRRFPARAVGLGVVQERVDKAILKA